MARPEQLRRLQRSDVHFGAVDAKERPNVLTVIVLSLGIALAAWSLLLSPGTRALPATLLSVWGVLVSWSLPIQDSTPVLILCLSTSTAELSGFPLEEMGPLVVMAFWIARSLMGALLRHGKDRMPSSGSRPAITAVFALLACNMVVMGYQGVAPLVWLKSALPWLLCLAAYPVSRIHWTRSRDAHIFSMIALAGSMVSVADILVFAETGGVAGLLELGGETWVSVLPLLAIVAILASWGQSRTTVRNAGGKLGLLVAFIICLFRVALSIQRAWLIGVVIGVGVWLWVGQNQTPSRSRRLASAVSLVVCTTLVLVFVAPANQVFRDAYRGFVARISRSFVSGSFDYSIGTRLVEIPAALSSLRRSPWFGTGLGSIVYYVRPNGVAYAIDYIHIGPVFVLAKLGIVGLAVVGWLAGYIAVTLHRGRTLAVGAAGRYMGSFLSAELCVTAVLFLATRYVFEPSNAALIWVLIGMAMSLSRNAP